MSSASLEPIKDQMIQTGKSLYAMRLVVGKAGNLSARVSENAILVTATGAALGNLSEQDIIRVDFGAEADIKNSRLTSEFPLHSLVYKNFPRRVVIHCHPTLVNAYFAVSPKLKSLTFESKLYLGDVPVVEQDTPSITRPELVIEALKTNNIVVIRNHGVVAVADKFADALALIESLEEAVKALAVARLFEKDILDELDKEIKEELVRDFKSYPMFSREHIQAIVDLVNRDEFILKKGQELDLTLELAIKLDDAGAVFKFTFLKGRITKLDCDANAPYVISAPGEIWQQVFLGKLQPFTATMQGKMKLQGQFSQLSRWYVPFSRLFELFRQVRIL